MIELYKEWLDYWFLLLTKYEILSKNISLLKYEINFSPVIPNTLKNQILHILYHSFDNLITDIIEIFAYCFSSISSK